MVVENASPCLNLSKLLAFVHGHVRKLLNGKKIKGIVAFRQERVRHASADARTDFRWRICGQREGKQPWNWKKAELAAFLRGKSAALLALEKRQRKVA
jgi:hypothetical protein